MPRHPSVPDNQTGWIRLGAVTTDTAMLAIVAPESAGSLGDDWTARYFGDDGEPLERAPGPPPEHEMVEFEELEADGKRRPGHHPLRRRLHHRRQVRRHLRRRPHEPARGAHPHLGLLLRLPRPGRGPAIRLRRRLPRRRPRLTNPASTQGPLVTSTEAEMPRLPPRPSLTTPCPPVIHYP